MTTTTTTLSGCSDTLNVSELPKNSSVVSKFQKIFALDKFKNRTKSEPLANKKQIWFASFSHMFCDLNPGALPALLPYLKDAYGLSYSMTTGLMFANAGFSSVLQPIFGLVADKKPKYWYMALAILISGCGMAAVGFLSSYWLMFIAIMLSGIGTALFHPVAMKFVYKVTGTRKKGSGTSIFSVGGNAGYLFAPVVAVGLVSLFGMKGLILLAPLAFIIASIALIESKRFESSSRTTTQKTQIEDTVKNDYKSFSLLTVCVICRSTVMICLRAFIPLYFISKFNQTPESAAIALTLFGAFGIAGNILGGRASDILGELFVIRSNHSVLLLLLVIFPFVSNFYIAYALLLLLGFVFFMSFSPLIVLGQKYMSKSVGFAAGVTLGLGTTFGGIFAPVLGYAADIWGLPITFHLLSIGVAIGLATSFVLKDSQIQDF